MNTIDGNHFHRSTFCGTGGCVEVAPMTGGMVAVRDSKDLTVPQHLYTRAEWVAFIQGVKAGEFDFNSPADPSGRSPGV